MFRLFTSEHRCLWVQRLRTKYCVHLQVTWTQCMLFLLGCLTRQGTHKIRNTCPSFLVVPPTNVVSRNWDRDRDRGTAVRHSTDLLCIWESFTSFSGNLLDPVPSTTKTRLLFRRLRNRYQSSQTTGQRPTLRSKPCTVVHLVTAP